MGATRKRGRWPQGSVGATLLCAKLGVQGAKRAELRARAEVWFSGCFGLVALPLLLPAAVHSVC